MKTLASKWSTALAICMLALVTGCASAPTQEMSDARQVLQAAREAGAEQYAPNTMNRAEDLLREAERELRLRYFSKARNHAEAARTEALKGQNMTNALASAKAALDEAGSRGVLSHTAQESMRQAMDAARRGDERQAIKFAGEAQREAEQALKR